MAQTLGIVDLTWRGARLDIEKGAKLRLGGYKQNAVTASRRQHHAQEFEGSEITATLLVKRGMRITELFAGGEGELQALCDTGQSFAWGDAFVMNRPDLTAGEGGKAEIKWGASEPEELQNG